MQTTFTFIILSFETLLDNEFYIFPLCLISFLFLIDIVKRLRGVDK